MFLKPADELQTSATIILKEPFLEWYGNWKLTISIETLYVVPIVKDPLKKPFCCIACVMYNLPVFVFKQNKFSGDVSRLT